MAQSPSPVPQDDFALYFSDFLIESNAQQCDWCGEIRCVEEVKPVQLDVADGWTWVCTGCLEGYDRRHCT